MQDKATTDAPTKRTRLRMTSFQNPPFALGIRSCIHEEGEAKTKGLKGERKGERLDEGLKKEERETNEG